MKDFKFGHGVRYELPNGIILFGAFHPSPRNVNTGRLNFEMMVDLTVVDWFRKKEPRFEVVVQFLSTSQNLRKTVKVFVKDEDLTLPSITEIYPSANFYEREAYDMFGIVFENHPDFLFSYQ